MSKPTETVDRILMAKNGNVSIGIRVAFHDKYHTEDLDALQGASLALPETEN